MKQKYLKECLIYDPLTGLCFWKVRPVEHFKDGKKFSAQSICNVWNGKYANKPTGNLNNDGYIAITIDYKRYYLHRLAYLYIEGYMPENFIDHIDQNPSNNKWCNFREATQMCNMQNKRKQSNNKSGVTGVCWANNAKKYLAQITINRENKNLGMYKDFSDAVLARYNEEQNNPLWTCSKETSAEKYVKSCNLI